MSGTAGGREALLFIDGRWRAAAGGASDELRDPATGEVVGSVARAGEADVDEALAAVDRGFAAWRRSEPAERARVLREAAAILRSRAEEVAGAITAEQGKPLGEARSEVEQSAGYFDWYAGEATRERGRRWSSGGREFIVERRPIGPVAAFSAWNFPASLPARKIAPAIAAGCGILVKPAEEAPGAAAALVEALVDAGLPGAVIALVTGDAPAIARQVIGSPVIRKITLTGSIPVGRELVRLSAEPLQPLSLELGGHAPVIVLPGADVPAVARALAGAKFRNAGQVCISPTRFFVPGEAAEEFAEHFAAAAAALTVGPGDRDGVEVGPLANERRLEAVSSLVDDLRAGGARVLTGGRRVESLPGWFYEPTVVIDVHEDARILTEEPFGPIAPVLPYRSVDEAVARANAVEQGLAAYVFGPEGEARDVASRLDVGMIGVNGTALAVAEAPFGGVKSSGYGREGGTEGLDEYTVAVYTQVAPRDR
ncbi:aldehyde dehydrogenase family protein [Glycomyces tenuis]|uniref:aldehyde dehydrogenase family protein n=1 Tax=Glycomyces tenuis TaxID=58116 RepID=UPI0005582968|nr:aldehyde dehydrogenase family protein [Glycomyces tenuis]